MADFEGVISTVDTGPVDLDEARHFMVCPACGMAFDKRDLAQALPHFPLVHERPQRTEQ